MLSISMANVQVSHHFIQIRQGFKGCPSFVLAFLESLKRYAQHWGSRFLENWSDYIHCCGTSRILVWWSSAIKDKCCEVRMTLNAFRNGLQVSHIQVANSANSYGTVFSKSSCKLFCRDAMIRCVEYAPLDNNRNNIYWTCSSNVSDSAGIITSTNRNSVLKKGCFLQRERLSALWRCERPMRLEARLMPSRIVAYNHNNIHIFSAGIIL